MNDYAYNLINKVTSVVCGLVISVILARYLGVILRGELGFIVQLSALIAIVLGLGVGQAFIRYFKLSPTSETFAEIASLLLFQMVIFCVIGLAVIGISRDSSIAAIVALSLSLAAFQQCEAMMSAYDIRFKIKVHIVYTLTRLVLHILIWLLAERSLMFPVLVPVLLALLGSAAYLLLANRPRLPWPSTSLAKKVYSFGWLPMVTTLLILLNYNVDLIMLRSFGTDFDLGIYAVAASVVTYLWIIPDSIKEVLISRVVRTSDRRGVLLPLKAAVTSGFICVLLWAAVGWFFVPVFYGVQYTGSYQLILILSLGVVAMVYYKIFGVIVMSEGKRAFYFICLLLAVIINIAFNLWAIPEYGATGAAWVSVASYSFTGATFIFYFARITDCSLREILVFDRQEVRVILSAVRRLRG